MPANLPVTGPYSGEDILNAVLNGTTTAWQLRTILVAGTAVAGTLVISTGTVTVTTGTVNIATGTVAISGTVDTELGAVVAGTAAIATSTAAPLIYAGLLGAVTGTWKLISAQAGGDAPGAASTALLTHSRRTYFETILASAGRTADVNAADNQNHFGKGGIFYIDITGTGTTSTVQFNIQRKDSESGKYSNILQSTIATAIGTIIMLIYPGVAGTANIKADDVLPYTYRLQVDHTGTESFTYSVGVHLIG